jgi:hypothetical protein
VAIQTSRTDRASLWRLCLVSGGSAVVGVFLALFLAVFATGPITRAFLGTPPGFHDHFVSNAGLLQAAVAQALSIALAFLLQGFIQRRDKPSLYRQALFAANPFVIAIAFLVFKIAYEALPLPHHDIEFYSVNTGLWLVIGGAIPFAACYALGALLSVKHTPRPS